MLADKLLDEDVDGKLWIIQKNIIREYQEAFAAHDDKFIAVGANREILNLAGPGTVKIDLRGKTVIPGLNEGHCHPQMASLSEEDQEIL